MEANINSGKINEQKLNDFMLRAVGDIASTISAVLVLIGYRLGLYKAMALSGKPITSEELARKTNTNERLIKEWLANQVASGYIIYNASNAEYFICLGRIKQ